MERCGKTEELTLKAVFKWRWLPGKKVHTVNIQEVLKFLQCRATCWFIAEGIDMRESGETASILHVGISRENCAN